MRGITYLLGAVCSAEPFVGLRLQGPPNWTRRWKRLPPIFRSQNSLRITATGGLIFRGPTKEGQNSNDLRAIFGAMTIAIKAYREGKLPFPDGTIIARLRPGVTSRRRENNKSLWLVPNLSSPGPATEHSVYGQGLHIKIRLDGRLGGSPKFLKTVNPPIEGACTTRCFCLSRARSTKLAILSSTHLRQR